MLRMFDGEKLVDTVRVSGATSTIQLDQNSVGVFLTQGVAVGEPGGPGTAIPLHIV
jgi:hypothetical protein